MKALFQARDINIHSPSGHQHVVLIPLVVAHEKIFTMGALYIFPVPHGLFYGWGWGMLMVLERDGEILEKAVDCWVSNHSIGGILPCTRSEYSKQK